MPRVEIVQKHNTAARRLYIRGHNGKIYPYLVMNDACLTESRREERVLQLLRLLNPCLEKRKETTKRHLFFTGTRAASSTPRPAHAPHPAGHVSNQRPPGEEALSGRTAVSAPPGARLAPVTLAARGVLLARSAHSF